MVKCYWDSSALIAALVLEEDHHDQSLDALKNQTGGSTSTHALAEVFATLTGGKLGKAFPAADALAAIQAGILERLEVLPISLQDYCSAFAKSQSTGARGGAVFDLLHLEVARRINAQKIFTINLGHFRTFAPDLPEGICLPSTLH